VSRERLEAFKRTASPGDRMTYFTGLVTDDNRLRIEPTLAAAWAGYASGLFDLVQRRVGPCRFDHMIVRRRKRAEILDAERVGHIEAARRRYEDIERASPRRRQERRRSFGHV
jgi:hypothetical protein